MTDRKRMKKDNRASVTVHLPAAYADFIAELLARELDSARREKKKSLAATIQDILNPLRSTIELEERQRDLRAQAGRKKRAEDPALDEEQEKQGR